MDDAVSRLENLLNDLVMYGRFSEAYTIASEFGKYVIINNGSKGSLHGLPDGSALLKSLSERPDVPIVVRAKSIDRLADAAENSGDTTTSRNLEAHAMDLFNQSGHAHGTLDILFRQACRNIREGAVDLDHEMELIKGYLQAYKSQQFLLWLHISVATVMSSAACLFNFELQLELAHRSEDLATKGGAKLFWMLHYTGILARWLTHSGRAPTVIEGAKILYEDLQECDCQCLKGLVAQITVQAYLEIGDRQNSLEWSELCKDSWRFCSPMDRAKSFTIELRSQVRLHLDGDVIDTIIKHAVIKIDEEIENGLIIPAINQMDHIVTQVFMPKNDKGLLPWIRRMEEMISQLDGIDADIKRANLYHSHASTLLTEDKNTHMTQR